MPPLKNNRHEIFAQSLVKGMTQKDAAIEAGYEPKSVDAAASRLLRNVKICERISELQGKTESETILTVKERKEILSEMARGNVGDFVVISEDGKDIQFVPKIAKSPAVASVRTEQKMLGNMLVRVVRLGLVDKARAIAELNKMEGQYPPSKVEVGGKDGQPIPVAATITEIIKVRDRGGVKEAEDAIKQADKP